MTQLGADPDDLRGLARSLRSAAGQLDALSTGLARRSRTAGWRGPDADAFEHQWVGRDGPALHATSAGLTELAHRVDRQVDEQLQASAAARVGAPLGAATPPRTPDREAELPALPVAEDRYLGTVELRIGPVTAALAGGLVVQQLDGGRRRVVLTETAGAGAVTTVGASTELGVGGPHGAGASNQGGSADARLRAGAVQRRSWEVDADEVDDLLARLALEHAGLAVTGHGQPLGVAAAVLDGVVDRVTGHDPGWDLATSLATSVPTPVSHEELVEVELAAGAGLGLGGLAGLGARAQTGASVRVGTAHRGDTTATVLEVQGSATGALTGSLLRRLGVSLPPDAHRGVVVRVELPDPTPDDSPHALVRVSTTTDARVHDVIARVDLAGDDGAATASALARTVQHLARADLPSAVATLGAAPVDPGHVTVRSTTGALSGSSARAGASAGVGIGGGASVRGHVLHVDRG